MLRRLSVLRIIRKILSFRTIIKQHPLLIALIADQKSQIYELQTTLSMLTDNSEDILDYKQKNIAEIELAVSESGKYIPLKPVFSCSNKDQCNRNYG